MVGIDYTCYSTGKHLLSSSRSLFLDKQRTKATCKLLLTNINNKNCLRSCLQCMISHNMKPIMGHHYNIKMEPAQHLINCLTHCILSLRSCPATQCSLHLHTHKWYSDPITTSRKQRKDAVNVIKNVVQMLEPGYPW